MGPPAYPQRLVYQTVIADCRARPLALRSPEPLGQASGQEGEKDVLVPSGEWTPDPAPVIQVLLWGEVGRSPGLA